MTKGAHPDAKRSQDQPESKTATNPSARCQETVLDGRAEYVCGADLDPEDQHILKAHHIKTAKNNVLLAYEAELMRRDAECETRCDGCQGRHGAVLVCGGCDEPEGDCAC